MQPSKNLESLKENLKVSCLLVVVYLLPAVGIYHGSESKTEAIYGWAPADTLFALFLQSMMNDNLATTIIIFITNCYSAAM